MRSVDGQAPEASRGTETGFPESLKYGFHRRIIKTAYLHVNFGICELLITFYLSMIVCLSVCPSLIIRLSVCPSLIIRLSVCPSLIMRLSVCPSLVNRLFVCPLAISLNIQDGDLILI